VGAWWRLSSVWWFVSLSVTLDDPARRSRGERARLRGSYFTGGGCWVYDGPRLLGRFDASPMFEVWAHEATPANDCAHDVNYWRVAPEVSL